MTAIEITCRVCCSLPYELCTRIDAYGKKYTAQVTHTERIEDAAAISAPERAEDPALVDEAFAAVMNELL